MDVYAIFVRKCLYPLYYKKNGSSVSDHLSYYEKTQYFSSNDISRLQWKQLLRIVAYAYKHTKFYRQRFEEAGFDPVRLKSYNDFIHVPFLTKDDIQRNLKNLIADSCKEAELVRDRTGGSTGMPLLFYYDKQRLETREALRIRSNRWSSWDLGEKTAIIWGARRDRSDGFKSRIKAKLLRKGLFLDAYSLDEKKMAQFAMRLKEYKPRIIIGYAGALSLFAKYLSAIGDNNVRADAIISTAEALSNDDRKRIEIVFNAQVFERYGCRELGPIAAECGDHTGLHINAESLFVEVVDPQTNLPVETGEPGEIVITDLLNYSMPFIRYKIGDTGRLLRKECKCGRGLPLMDTVAGRTVDFIKTPNGKIIAGPMAIPLLCEISGILQAQIIQEYLDRIIIRVRCSAEFNNDSKRMLLMRCREVFGEQMKVTLEIVKNIPQEPSGKYRFVISKLTKDLKQQTLKSR